jgi:hypothetical protein
MRFEIGSFARLCCLISRLKKIKITYQGLLEQQAEYDGVADLGELVENVRS